MRLIRINKAFSPSFGLARAYAEIDSGPPHLIMSYNFCKKTLP